MLEVEEPVVLERRVVGSRDVPEQVAPEPEGQRDQGPRQEADDPEARERLEPRAARTATRSSGIHSASATFWTRCAQRR